MQQTEIIEEIANQIGLASGKDLNLDLPLRDLELLPGQRIDDLIKALGAHFDIQFTPEDTLNLQTVRDLVDTIEDLLLE